MVALIIPSAKGAIPGVQGISHLLVNSIANGTANAFLTLRVGIVARRYLEATAVPSRQETQRSATVSALALVGAIARGKRGADREECVECGQGLLSRRLFAETRGCRIDRLTWQVLSICSLACCGAAGSRPTIDWSRRWRHACEPADPNRNVQEVIAMLMEYSEAETDSDLVGVQYLGVIPAASRNPVTLGSAYPGI